MPFDTEDNSFLLAGPVKMHPRVTRAMSVPAVAHRSPEFLEVNERLFRHLRTIHRTRHDVVAVAGSGTAAADMAMGSLLAKGDKVVTISNGKFGDRISKLAERYADATVVEADWGQAPDMDEVRDALQGAKALAFVHNETSTAMTNPIDELVEAADQAGALVIVDAITSLGGIPLDMDDWGIDAVISGSQKCLGGPAGLSFLALSDQANGFLRAHPSFYLDAPKYVQRARQNNTPFTGATHLHLGMVEALDLILEEGLEARWARIAAQAEAVRAAGEAMDLELFPDPEHASDTVTAFQYPQGLADDDVRAALKARGVMVAGGQAHVKGRIFRIGHMGTVTWADLAGGIALLERVLLDAGHKFQPGAGVSAFTEQIPASAEA